MADLSSRTATYQCEVLRVFVMELEAFLSPAHAMRVANLLVEHAVGATVSAATSLERARLVADTVCRTFVPLMMQAVVDDLDHVDTFRNAPPLTLGDRRAFHLTCDDLSLRRPEVQAVVSGVAVASRQVIAGGKGLRMSASNSTRALREVLEHAGWGVCEVPFYQLLTKLLQVSSV